MNTQDKANNMPLIGDEAPEFIANTTDGEMHFPNDYAGSWVILFSHPSDFTPVCTSEFMAFQALYGDFKRLNTELVALSVGSISSHLAWIEAISKLNDGVGISFPIIDDAGANVARQYGMIHENADSTHTVRAVFIIDPDGIIRAVLYYPATLGRNLTEIMRMLVGLQTADKFGVATPANWIPGDDILIPSPQNTWGLMKTLEKSKDESWFMRFKPLGADIIYDTLTKH